MNAAQSDLGIANWVGTKLQTMAHFARANTIEGSRKNINEHYDLGNDMYKLFLDETWMYSSGVFNSPTDTLYQSQINKVAHSTAVSHALSPRKIMHALPRLSLLFPGFVDHCTRVSC